MALEVNAFKTISAGATFVDPTVYDEEAVKHLYFSEVFRPLGITDNDLLDSAGKTFNKYIEGQWAVGALTEGTDTPVSAYVVSQVTVTIGEYGDAKQFSQEQISYQFDSVMKNVKYNAVGAIGENRDSVIVAELMATTTPGLHSNGKTALNILTTDTFNGALLVDADVAMRQTQARGMKACVLHPVQLGALRKDTNFIDYNKNPITSNQVLRTGEIGSYQGITILESVHTQTAVENTITVYKAIALGNNQPFVFMPKTNPIFEWDREYNRKRALTFHYREMFGVKRLIEESVMVLTSA